MVRSASGPLQLWVIAIILGGLFNSRVLAANGQCWGPLGTEATLEILTVDQVGHEHWSTFWWVVIEGKLYLRLGPRGAERIRHNRNTPFVSVNIAGQRFDDVRAIPAPEMAEAVAAAMAKKYPLGLFLRYVPHPSTLRLERGV